MTKPILRTIDIHGKSYVPVSERIRAFHDLYPNGWIETEVSYDGEFVRCKATVYPDAAFAIRKFVGHSEENRKDGQINATSSTENAETSAIGRALGFLGIGVDSSVASADELVSALTKQGMVANASQATSPAPKLELGWNVCDRCGGRVKKPYKTCYTCKNKAKPAATSSYSMDNPPPPQEMLMPDVDPLV